MLASFAEAGVILDRPDYTEAAQRNAEFVLANLRRDGVAASHLERRHGEV